MIPAPTPSQLRSSEHVHQGQLKTDCGQSAAGVKDSTRRQSGPSRLAATSALWRTRRVRALGRRGAPAQRSRPLGAGSAGALNRAAGTGAHRYPCAHGLSGSITVLTQSAAAGAHGKQIALPYPGSDNSTSVRMTEQQTHLCPWRITTLAIRPI